MSFIQLLPDTMSYKYYVLMLFLFLSSLNITVAQKSDTPKYNSLLWEITGNGLKKPSFLFGTMHVSSKLAFHLSDSFYHALKSVDAVALEINPEQWQPQMVRLNALNENYTNYVQASGNDYLTENSFRITKYDDNLKASLSIEPPVVNSLLYRSYRTKEDFEEDTFLDLYIFQTGRKLGKAPAGVEDYYQSEKLVLEAYADMAKEKKKKDIDLDGETTTSLVEKIQSAYRRGDLDLMDSIDNLMERSIVFREKFLYKRNEIQANSIDSIIKKTALFAGVGAAHLPGNRGVIELLRKKGYTLRPVKMSNRDAFKKEEIDKLKVKVNFTTQYAADGMYSVDVPGYLYVNKTAYQPLNRWQYADMNNGSYYLVTRVKTYASFLGQTEADELKKIDSVLYENIPGKIITKKLIENNGYGGYDITNRIRRGDLQRYQIFATPFEIIIFKMSGHNDYVNGEEATRFFGSIQLRKSTNNPINFEPPQGGFSILLPEKPHQFLNYLNNNRVEYEAKDKTNGDAYLIFKNSIYNYNFLEKDSFDLKLVEESFRNPDYFDKQIGRKLISINGLPGLLVRERLKTGDIVNAAYIIEGPHYYAIAKRSNNMADSSFAFLNSFKIQPFKYASASQYVDTFLHLKVNTPVAPLIDDGIRSVIEQSIADASNGNNSSGYTVYWPKIKNALLISDSTGEQVSIKMQEYPKYYYIKDSLKFWENDINKSLEENDLELKSKSVINFPNNVKGYEYTLIDTGSSRTIEKMILLKSKYFYTLTTMGDTVNKRSAFINSVFNSFSPSLNEPEVNLYQNKLPVFFADLFSKDSALHKKAQESISNVYFGGKAATDLYNAINRLSFDDKDYFSSKTKLIAELGYIKDSVTDIIPQYLKKIYEQTADTSIFQNEAIKALARLKTATSYKILKDIMLQNPPVFVDNDYNSLFEKFEDSLQLSAKFFPDLLQLTTLEDYKEPITNLLVTLVDSGFVNYKAYEKYFTSIYIDAKVAQKKQQIKDEKKMQEDKKKEDDNDYNSFSYSNYNKNSFGLDDYGVLLMPFYDKNTNVQQYFNRMLLSKDELVKMNAAVLMLRNNKPVPDSILNALAADDKYFAKLYYKLEQAIQLDKLPLKYRNQQALARSYLVEQNSNNKIDSIVFIKKTIANVLDSTGMVYFFKYRLKNSDDWKIGISGMQPINENKLSSNDNLVLLTNKRLKESSLQDEQLDLQLKRILFSLHKSAKNFFTDDSVYTDFTSALDDDDN
jgi:uncharacterized protein YbaP (TraB family)